MSKGGRRKTTWQSTWNSGETKLVRIPIALEPDVMAYARAVDNNNVVNVPRRVGDTSLILEVIEKYIEYRRTMRHPNQHSKDVDVNARTWDELRKFRKLLQENPSALGLNASNESSV